MKRTFIAMLFLTQGYWAHSQKVYISASCGYNISVEKSGMDNFIYNKLVGAFYSFTKERLKYSLGKGMNFNFGIGYQTKRNIGFEWEGSYLMGTKTIGSTDYFTSDVFKKEIWGRFYRISPGIYLIQPLNKFSLKIGAGALVGFGKMYLNQSTTYNDGIAGFTYENEFSGGSYLGFKAGISVLYAITDKLSLFAEINGVNAWFSPKRGKVKRFISGEKDYTDMLEVWDREFVYSDSADKTFYGPNEPAYLKKENFAASSIGLQVGMQWSIWRKVRD